MDRKKVFIENGQKKSFEGTEKFRCTVSLADTENEKTVRKQVSF